MSDPDWYNTRSQWIQQSADKHVDIFSKCSRFRTKDTLILLFQIVCSAAGRRAYTYHFVFCCFVLYCFGFTRLVIESSPSFHLFSFCLVLLCVFTFWVPCYNFRMKTMFGSSSYIVLSLCFVFLRLVYPMWPVSLHFPFLIAPSVFSNVHSSKHVTCCRDDLTAKLFTWTLNLNHSFTRLWSWKIGLVSSLLVITTTRCLSWLK